VLGNMILGVVDEKPIFRLGIATPEPNGSLQGSVTGSFGTRLMRSGNHSEAPTLIRHARESTWRL